MLHSESLDVATPERVSLRLPVAGLGFRSLAYLIDALLIFLFWVVLYFVTSLLANVAEEFQALSSVGRSVLAFAVFAAQWCYWTVCEIAMNGQTVGKRVMHIRVVRLDGSPVTPIDSALRNLIRFVDFLPLAYSVGLVTMLFNKDNRRLGDLVAGTVLVRDEKVDLSRYLNTQAQPPGTASEQELLLDFLQRAPLLLPEPRARLATRFAQRYCGNLSAEDRARVLASAPAAEAFLRELTQVR
jgi:uncharacterized RDD family membrane protein YckC